MFLYGRALQEEIEVSDDGHSQQFSATENVVRVRVLLGEFKPMMAASIQELRRAGLKIDCFGFNENADRTTSLAVPSMLNKPLSCPITVLCNDICAALKKRTLVCTEGMFTREWPSHSLHSSSFVL